MSMFILKYAIRFPGQDYNNPAPDLFKPPPLLQQPIQSASSVSPAIDSSATEIHGEDDIEYSTEPRDLYPRMPWHDVQASVSGLTARDCAAHFVQVLILVTTC